MSAQSHTTLTLTVVAAGTIVANRAVGYDLEQSGAGEDILGVADSAASSGDQLAVATDGTAEVEAGAAFSVGAQLTTDASGKFVAATSTDVAVATALPGNAASADGDIVEVLLKANPTLA